VLQALNDAVGRDPDNAQLRKLLGGHYLRTQHPDEALEQFSRIEELEGNNGAALLDFGDWSNREGFHSTALKAYERLLELFPESPLGPKAYQGLGQSLEKMGLFQEAIATFRTLTARYGRSREAEYALFEIGRIHLHQLANPDSALDAFQGLIQSGRQSRYALEAKSLIAECYFVKGDLVGAEQQYEQLKQETTNDPELAQEAAFRVAEMRYFRGDFDGALQELEALTQGATNGIFVNDALDLMVFIEEHRLFGDDALRAFALAAVLERQGKAGEAITAYLRLPTYYPQSQLGDDALLHVGGLHKAEGEVEAALETYRSILSRYPDCEQGDEVQRRIGEIYEEDLRDIPRAIDAYEQLLASYPKSLLFDSVRKRVRELQEKSGPTG
jgi:tetratricopeptide (TPR) repeat protein